MNRINDKIDEINEYLRELDEIVPASLDEYKSSNLTRPTFSKFT